MSTGHQPSVRGKSRILAREGKIIRREDVACYQKSKQVLDLAQKEATRIRKTARKEVEDQRSVGYDEGIREGRREQSRLFVDAILRRDMFFAEVEQEVCDLVIAGVRKIFADFDDAERTRILVQKALSTLRSQTQAVIRIHPNQYDSVKQDFVQVTAAFPNLSVLTIEPDGTIPESTCIMSSEMGTVEANIETQIQALEIALARAMANRQHMATGISPGELAALNPFAEGSADTMMVDLIAKAKQESSSGATEESQD